MMKTVRLSLGLLIVGIVWSAMAADAPNDKIVNYSTGKKSVTVLDPVDLRFEIEDGKIVLYRK